MSYIHYHQVIPNTTIPNGWSGDWIKPNDFYPYPPIQPILPPTTTTTTTACWPPIKKNRVLYTGGSFDLFHANHVKFLKRCADLVGEDGEVVVSLNTDEFIEKFKGKAPVYPYAERKCILESCVYVDKVIENVGGEDSKPAILSVNPDIICIGSDWANKNYFQQMQFTSEWLEERQILLVYLPYSPGVTSTLIKQQLNG